MRGEVADTLRVAEAARHAAVLGLRDVMDEPALLVPEWERKKVRAGAEEALRRHLGLWPAADLRSAGRRRPAAERAQEDDLYRLSAAHAAAAQHAAAGAVRRSTSPSAGDHRRRRRRRGAHRLGAARLRARRPSADAGRCWCSAPSCSRSCQAEFMAPRRAAEEASTPSPSTPSMETLMDARRGRGRHGRLQHLLRDPVLRQAGAHRAAHGAAPRAVHPRRARPGAGPGADADRRRPAAIPA